MNKKLTVSDFFCGAGGWSEGFRQKGFDLIFSLDHWKPAVDTHLFNHPNCECLQMDILDFEDCNLIDKIIPNTDIIVGSPPCVSFSTSNKAGKADKTLGIRLIETFLRIVLWKKVKHGVKYWAMENVPNSESYVKEKYTWKELGLPGNGPDLEIPTRKILIASDYGSAQNRKRFVCGDYPIPEETHKGKELHIQDVFDDLWNPLKKPKEKIIDPIYNEFSLKGKEVTDHFYDTRINDFEWKKAKRMKEDHGFMGKMDFPERTNRTCRTVMATQSASTREAIIFGATKNNKEEWIDYRLPTIREISSFMGFPINYQFIGGSESVKYKLVGNAVCPPMSSAIAEAILKKEKLKVPNFIPLKLEKENPLNLNGNKRKIKTQKEKKINSKYFRHIPYLKLASLRVELSNKQSNFENNKIIWDSKLHWGSGKNAVFIEQINKSFIDEVKNYENFNKFENELEKIYDNRIYSSEEMQNKFCLLSDSNHFSPDELVENIKEVLDDVYPDKKYNTKVIENGELIQIGKKELPVRILMAFYALNKAIERLN